MNEESLNYSLRNLQHSKARNAMTVFSILIGIATIFLFVSFGLGLFNYTNSFTTSSTADKILVVAQGAGVAGTDENFKIDDDDLKVVKRAAGVYSASGVYWDSIQIEKRNEVKYTYLFSYDPKNPLIMDVFQVDLEKGRALQPNEKGVAVLGYNYLLENKIFEKPIELNDYITINNERVRVIGFFEAVGNPTDDSQVYVTNDYFLDLFPEKDTYAQIVARVDVSNIDKAIENVERGLRKHRDLEKGKEDFFVQSFEDFIESFAGAINIIIGFIILIAFISVLVSAINTANTMITSVLERYKEIGILKAIGARNSEIFYIFLLESAILGLIAGVLGVLLGWGVASLAGILLTNLGWGFLQPYFSFWMFFGCILFAVLTGAISGVIPALRASKINTVEALRYE